MTDDDPSSDQSPSDPQSAALTPSDDRQLECPLCPFESFEYRAEEGAYVAVFDADAVAPSTAVVGALATIRDTSPRSLPSLYDSVDPGALDSLLTGDWVEGRDVHVTFRLAAFDVTLSGFERTVLRLRPGESGV